MNKKDWFLVLLIGLNNTFGGAFYYVAIYRLLAVFDESQVALVPESYWYILQALGIALTALWFYKKQTFKYIRFAQITNILLILVTVWNQFTPSKAGVMLSGLAGNFLVGAMMGLYLSRLALCAKGTRAKVFGFGYAIGAVGAFLLSSINGGTYFKTRSCIWSILILGIVLAVLTDKRVFAHYTGECDAANGTATSPVSTPAGFVPSQKTNAGQTAKLWWMLAVLAALVSFVNVLGFNFSLTDSPVGLSRESSRAFYAISLISVGIISDRNRRFGFTACIASLAIPFICIVLSFNVQSYTVIWVLSYLFMGAYTVWRLIAIVDLSAESGYLWLTVAGIFFGRLGEALGSLISGAAGHNTAVFLSIAGVAFMGVIVMFLSLYPKMYLQPLPLDASAEESKNVSSSATAGIPDYGLTSREKEIAGLIAEGYSNVKIAETLFITENTVKFHVKNILKKTGASNRVELGEKIKNMS